MANTKSAKKRIGVTIKKTLRNKIVKTRTKNAVKKLVTACTAGNRDEAAKILPVTVSFIDKAAQKGVIHRNTASRKKSRLYKLVSKVPAK